MIKIKNLNNNTEYTYRTVNDAVQSNGGGGRNTMEGLKYLKKIGFDVDNMVDDGVKAPHTPNTTHTHTRTNIVKGNPNFIIEKLIEQCKVVDTDRIKHLQDALQFGYANINANSTPADLQKLVDLRNQISTLQNPVVTLDGVLSLVTKMFISYRKEETERTSDGKYTLNDKGDQVPTEAYQKVLDEIAKQEELAKQAPTEPQEPKQPNKPKNGKNKTE